MSSTPLFDSIARRVERSTEPTAPAPTTARAIPTPAPTSPLSAPTASRDVTLVPAALVAAINAIPTRTPADTEHPVCAERLVLVEAVADAITRAVVDAVATELERIARDGVVRA